MPKRRDVYLKIEKSLAYSSVAPDDVEHKFPRLDAMRSIGHEDATIPDAEVERRRVDALVYREYLDPAYTIPNTEPLIAADINEPRFDRRIPGALIYTEPGERLFIHVFNADDAPHSLHAHGLIYGVDSDGRGLSACTATTAGAATRSYLGRSGPISLTQLRRQLVRGPFTTTS